MDRLEKCDVDLILDLSTEIGAAIKELTGIMEENDAETKTVARLTGDPMLMAMTLLTIDMVINPARADRLREIVETYKGAEA